MQERRELPTYLKKTDLPGDVQILYAPIVCREIYDPDRSASRMYTHEMLEIAVVTEGTGVHRILNQAIPCRENDVYVIASGIPHGYFLNGSGESLTVRRLYMDAADWFAGAVAAVGDARYCYGIFRDNAVTAYAMLNAETRREVDALLLHIVRETDEKKPEWRDAIGSYLSLLLIALGRYVNDAIKTVPDAPAKEWGIVSSAIRMVSERFSESELTLESIAESLYISKSHLSRLFGRLTGVSFSDYLRGVRISHATRLLRSTPMTVEETVKACGLRDIPSFYRAFHAYTNMTPSQYRASLGNRQRNTTKGEKIMVILSEISENLQRGKAKLVREMVEAAIAEGCDLERILNEGLLDGMNVIGEKFKNNEVYVPEVLVAARAMNMGMQVLKPYLQANGVQASGRVCIGTVRGDLHDIGKNLVRMMMEGKGLDVIDLGVDVAPETFVRTAIEQNCQVICCSALLTTTMGVMEEVVKAAEAAGIRDKVKIMIGGAPVNEEFCKKIGADCYTVDAASAADAAVALCANIK